MELINTMYATEENACLSQPNEFMSKTQVIQV